MSCHTDLQPSLVLTMNVTEVEANNCIAVRCLRRGWSWLVRSVQIQRPTMRTTLWRLFLKALLFVSCESPKNVAFMILLCFAGVSIFRPQDMACSCLRALRLYMHCNSSAHAMLKGPFYNKPTQNHDRIWSCEVRFLTQIDDCQSGSG